jgi:predicted nucleotidyltransferase
VDQVHDLVPAVRTLPLGTKVVTRIPLLVGGVHRTAGIVGVVVALPGGTEQCYRVRFPDDAEALLLRHDLLVHKEARREGLGAGGIRAESRSWDTYIILRCVVGSRAYGLDRSGSDTDRRGVYLPPADLHWSLAGVPEQLENDADQECYWEIRKFLILALKANPNVLECLYTPLIEEASSLGTDLLAMRATFLSRLVYTTYNGYVLSQFKSLERGMRITGGIKWKHAMHLLRLLLSGIIVLREGFVPVRLESHRERLLAIRDGILPWAEVEGWRRQLHAQFDAAFAATRLPEYPDYERADSFLRRARRSMI